MRWLILFLLLSTLPALAGPAQFGEGVATLEGKDVLSGTDAELTEGYKQGLKNGGASDATIEAIEKAGGFKRAVDQLKKKPPRADTFVFYESVGTDGIRKWSVTVLAGNYPSDAAKVGRPTHEEGHRKIDGAAVEALNKYAKDRKPDFTRQQTVDLLQAYENAGNKEYHNVFGGKPKDTEANMAARNLDIKGLQQKAVEEGSKAGQKALEEAVARLGHASAPRPAIRSLLPESAAVGTTIFVLGSGFGSTRGDVVVWFGDEDGQVTAVRDGSIAVKVPDCADEACPVSVAVRGQYSEPVAFAVSDSEPAAAPSVRVKLAVAKNPVGVGEETTGTFTVENTDKPVRIHFVNRSPAIVEFVGGNEQTVTSSGGTPNTCTFRIRGVSGPRLYDVDYDWRRAEDI